jgi:two-component system phosphate regulon response regulator PhoB
MPPKIIIIEDDIDTLDIMTYILSEEGYEVIAAKNREPLKQIHLHQPVLILLDNQLADGSGHDLCHKLKNDPDTMKFPVALVSANNNLEKMAQECLADAYLKKPFDIAELLALVKQFAS